MQLLDSDKLNVLLISCGKNLTPIVNTSGKEKEGSLENQLKNLKETLSDTKFPGDLVKLAKTVDQAQAVLTSIEAIAEKTLS